MIIFKRKYAKELKELEERIDRAIDEQHKRENELRFKGIPELPRVCYCCICGNAGLKMKKFKQRSNYDIHLWEESYICRKCFLTK